MQLIAVSALLVPTNRQRREFDPKSLQELQNSIEANGLLQPIVVRENPDDKYTWLLVAGERRLRAIENFRTLGGTLKVGGGAVPDGQIPVVHLGELDPLAAEEAELEENIRRVDLSWDEKAAATLRLSNLRTKQAEIAGTSPPNTEDLARELGRQVDFPNSFGGKAIINVRKELIVAKHLTNPEVRKAKNLDEAFKVLVREESTRKNVALAETVGRSFTSAVHRLHQADSILWMHDQPPEQFDVILTDPPYGMDAQDFGDAGGRLVEGQDHQYDDSLATWKVIMNSFALESFHIAKPQAHCYVCCDIDNFGALKYMMKTAGWYVFRTPLINYKVDGNRVPLSEHGPQRKYELILFAIKGWKKVTRIMSDVIHTHGDDNLGHGAQKPVELFGNLLSRSVRPGDTILDPFCGTGTIFPAAHGLKCAATGIELDKNYYGIALTRLKGLE